jgi:hypothetical protein
MAVNINVPSQVRTFANLAAFPASGALKTIYIAEDTNKTYRWTGSVYVEVSASASGITIGTTAITSGTVGRVLFEGTGNVVQESANLFWDNTNGRLGIGTSSPNSPIHIVYNPTSQNGINIDGSLNSLNHIAFSKSGIVYARMGVNASTGEFRWDCTSSYFPSIYSSGVERLRIPITGNVLINTTTDAGFRLDVNGTARFTGQFSSGASSNFQICQNSGNVNFQVRADGYVQFNNYTPLSGGTMNVLDGSRISMFGGGPLSGNINQFSMSHLFQTNVSSHTYTGVLISTTINQTGGANGITRGLYINPTLTSAFDFRAIETTAGNVIFNGGNVGIGTSSPAYVLDVVGGFRIGSSTIKLGMGESGGNSVFVGSLTNQPLKFLVNTNEYARIATTGNVLINTTTDAGFRLDVNGTARVVTSILVGAGSGTGTVQTGVCRATYFNSYANNFTIFETNNSTGNAKFYQGVSVGTSSDPVASAQVEIVSTTKGFLPPRMTTTQKNAIATPATGLQIYDTTLNRPCFYDGTTWITL